MKAFFSEESKLSMTRLLSFLTCLTGLAIGIIAAYKGDPNGQVTAICLGFVSAGLGVKLFQKGKEK
jgi:hypothetical protein